MSDDEHYDGPSDISFAGYRFAAHKACIACRHVMEDGKPLLGFVHEPDGGLQFLCGEAGHSDEDIRGTCLHCVIDRHPDVHTLPVVDFGLEAWRETPQGAWVINLFVDED